MAYFAGVLIYFVMTKKINIRFTLLLLLFLLFLFYSLNHILTQDLSDRFTIESVLSSGGTGRTDIWKGALTSYSEESFLRQLLGFGFGSFGTFNYIHSRYYAASHNDFIGMLIELGFIGFLLYMYVWIFLFRKAFLAHNWIGFSLLAVVFVGCFSMELIVKKMLWMVWFFAVLTQVGYGALHNNIKSIQSQKEPE